MTKVLVTELEYSKAKDVFSQRKDFECIPSPPSESRLCEKIRSSGALHVIVGIERYRDELYSTLPPGSVIARFGVGHDGIDKNLAKKNGILCTNTPSVLNDSVAECTIGLILGVARNIAGCAASTKGGAWNPAMGQELAGKTLAIIGCGPIGRKVAQIAKFGFGMRTHGVARKAVPADPALDHISTEFDAVAKEADFLSLHIPDIPENRDLINEDRLWRMKKTAVLINTARGALVDEVALWNAVESGTIAGAALDVTKKEPYEPQTPDKDLRTLSNILMTPHIGSSTREACERMANAALENILLAIRGRFEEMSLITPL